MEEIRDKASEAYWTAVWENSDLNPAINLRSKDLHFYPQRALDKMFKKALRGKNTKGMKLLEIGCGNSAWLPYFRNEFGFDVYGIDYSEEGCEQAKKILEREEVDGTIYCTDAFSPAEDLLSEFDVVCSFGVVEHFNDTAQTLFAFSKYLKKGGLLITTIPNMCGVNGWMHKVMNRELYDIHVPIDRNQLSRAVVKSELRNIDTSYYVCVSFNVQLKGIEKPVKYYKLKRFISRSGALLNLFFWGLEERLGRFPQSRLFSRGIFSAAEKVN